MPSDPSSDDPVFHISHIDRVYTLKADTINERYTYYTHIQTKTLRYRPKAAITQTHDPLNFK